MTRQGDSRLAGGGAGPAGPGPRAAAGLAAIRFPVRLKILAAVLGLLTITVAAITASMARAFGDDKIAYVNDLAAIVAGSTATESATLLRGYLHNMDVLAAIVSDPAAGPDSREVLTARVFTRFPEFVAVVVAAGGAAETTIYDRDALADLHIGGRDLVARALDRLAALPPAAADSLRIGTLALPGGEPLLVLAEPLPPVPDQPPRVLLACIHLRDLAAAVERGRGFRSALVDAAGEVIVASREAAAESGWIRPVFAVRSPAQAGVVTREFTADGTQYIGARAGVRVAGVVAVTAVPRSAAYLTAQDLLDNLMLVSLALLAIGALIALLVARRLTQPIERLASAAARIGQGDFATRMGIRSSDEIGALAAALNSMVAGLQLREQALIQAQQALVRSEKMSAFGQLSAGIAHEVKNPLAGILGHAQLAMRRLGPDSPARPSLDLIAQETRRCSDIIDNLMRFARQDKPRFLPLDVNAVVEAALAIVDHQLGLRGIRIGRHPGSDLPPIEGDLNQLQQVLVNLAINAQQAMAGQRGELSVTTRASGGQVVIEVQDSGPGIPAELQARVFEPFFTTKAAGQGTGLGLSVSYGIIESHGGRIEVRSAPGEGATFVISLPAAAVQPAVQPAVQAGVAA